MSVKSTVYITREEAERRYVEGRLKRARREFELIAPHLDNEELEGRLEVWNDQDHGGEGFENYIIGEKS